MAAQTEFPTFCERENDKLFAFYIAFTGLKTPQIVYRSANEFLEFKMVLMYIFLKKIVFLHTSEHNKSYTLIGQI